MDILIGSALGFVLGLVVWWGLKRGGAGATEINIQHSITQLRAVGELTVFRLVTQQIVTAEQHLAGKWKDWVKWLLSTKKLAVIIEYGIDFKYDLRDQKFDVVDEGAGVYRLVMPPCICQTYIRDLKFYDERNARWLPWLLGDVTEALGPGFDEQDKNKLLEAARQEAEQKAKQMVQQLATEAQSSARQTLEALARGFDVQRVIIDFAESHAQTEMKPESAS
ncbi:MAG: DUF4230 domain-containing protein [Planctomycetes bacterium]|nr:DUF4230 domain-containing protein [Planctomycetota bacterium]